MIVDTVPDDPSLPAQGIYKYKLAPKTNPQMAMNTFREELNHEGYKTTSVNTYPVNGSLLYAFTANNSKFELYSSILEDTSKTTVKGPDDNLFVIHAGSIPK